jgi:hypothetical protein
MNFRLRNPELTRAAYLTWRIHRLSAGEAWPRWKPAQRESKPGYRWAERDIAWAPRQGLADLAAGVIRRPNLPN